MGRAKIEGLAADEFTMLAAPHATPPTAQAIARATVEKATRAWTDCPLVRATLIRRRLDRGSSAARLTHPLRAFLAADSAVRCPECHAPARPVPRLVRLPRSGSDRPLDYRANISGRMICRPLIPASGSHWVRRSVRHQRPSFDLANALSARPSGRQDSNLRPLVPQTSPYFSIRSEISLECFIRELVGMTTRARVIDYVGIAWTWCEWRRAAHHLSQPRASLSNSVTELILTLHVCRARVVRRSR